MNARSFEEEEDMTEATQIDVIHWHSNPRNDSHRFPPHSLSQSSHLQEVKNQFRGSGRLPSLVALVTKRVKQTKNFVSALLSGSGEQVKGSDLTTIWAIERPNTLLCRFFSTIVPTYPSTSSKLSIKGSMGWQLALLLEFSETTLNNVVVVWRLVFVSGWGSAKIRGFGRFDKEKKSSMVLFTLCVFWKEMRTESKWVWFCENVSPTPPTAIKCFLESNKKMGSPLPIFKRWCCHANEL